MTTAPNVVRLSCGAAARRARELAAAWAAEDALEQQLRAAKARTRALERQVSRDRGYTFPQRREVLARPERT